MSTPFLPCERNFSHPKLANYPVYILEKQRRCEQKRTEQYRYETCTLCCPKCSGNRAASLSILAYNSFQERNRGDSSYREEFYGIKNVTQTGEKKALASKNPCIISRFEKFKQGTWNRPNYVLRRSPSCSRDVE